MAVNDFTGKNIQNTYQRVVQTDGTNLADGTGSLLPISFDGNDVIISGSLIATEYSISSSVVDIQIAALSGSTNFGDSSDDTHTFIGNISSSGTSTLGGTTYISGSVYSGSNPNTKTEESLVALIVTGSIIPEGNDKWSLGSETNYFRDLYVSEESIKFISASGEVTQLRQKDAKALLEGRPVQQLTAVGGTDVFLRTQALFHETNDSSFIKTKTPGLWDFNGPGGNILSIDAETVQHTITLNSSDSKLILNGVISASKTNATHIMGGTTKFGSNTVTINGSAGHITSSGNISASGVLTVSSINGTINGGNF